jgi:hypothetical protein
MNTAEIVIREVQSASSFQVVQFLTESVGEARKPSHHHSHGKVLSLDVAGADFLRVRVTLHEHRLVPLSLILSAYKITRRL